MGNMLSLSDGIDVNEDLQVDTACSTHLHLQLAKLLPYLSMCEIYSTIILLSSNYRCYFRNPTTLPLLKKLICYDFPLIFFISSSLDDKLLSAQQSLSPTYNINSFICNIYTNFAQTLKIKLKHNPYESWFNDYIKNEHRLDHNLASIVSCGGISGIKYYIKHIAQTKIISINKLYHVPGTITCHNGMHDGDVLVTYSTFQSLSTANVKIDPYNKPINIKKYFMKNAIRVYLRCFNIYGAIVRKKNRLYVCKFRSFLLDEIVPYYPSIHENHFFAGILETELFQQTKFADELKLFQAIFSTLISPHNPCKSNTKKHRKSCDRYSRLIIETIFALPKKRLLSKCYQSLCDSNGVLFRIVSRLNQHYMCCWSESEIQSNFCECINPTLPVGSMNLIAKITHKYQRILYRNFKYVETCMEVEFHSPYALYGIQNPNTKNREAFTHWCSNIQLLCKPAPMIKYKEIVFNEAYEIYATILIKIFRQNDFALQMRMLNELSMQCVQRRAVFIAFRMMKVSYKASQYAWNEEERHKNALDELNCIWKEKKCDLCGNISNGSKKHKICAGCMMVAYCNSKCQKIHWNKQHKYVCNIVWSLLYPPLKLAFFERK
eukprot:120990_1